MEQYGIFARYTNCTFDKIKKVIPEEHREAFETCHAYAKAFGKRKKDGLGLILKGPVGTGKTSLAVAVLQEVIKQQGSGYFIPMVSLLDNLLTMAKNNAEEAARFERKVRTTPLLVLDDLGAEYENSWVTSKVDAIITERYNRMLPVIVTTNLKKGELMGRYRERIYDRLKGTSEVVNFGGESMRKPPKQEKRSDEK